MPTVAVMRLAHDVHGSPDRPTVVFLHGLSSSRETYAGIVDEIADDGWHVVNADLRGHGETGRADDYAVTAYAADVAELIGAVGGEPVVLVGHSLGGLTAHAAAIRHPDLVRAALLEDPPLFEGDDEIRNASPAAAFFPRFVAQVRAWQSEGASVDDIAASIATQRSPRGGTEGDRLSPEQLAARARALLAFDPAAMEWAIEGRVWIGYDPTASVACPLTVLAADPAVGAVFLPDHGAQLAAAVPHATFQTITGQAHDIHGDPDGRTAYLAALRSFLSDL